MAPQGNLPDDQRPGRSIAITILTAMLIAAVPAVAIALAWVWLS